MGEMIRLTAADGFVLAAYKATPAGTAKGALVVIQEIFGVNRHMRSVADGFARDGFACIVPALFDRIRPGIELGYGENDIAEGRRLKAGSPTDLALLDISAARDALGGQRVGVIGYCWGGFLAWVTATRLSGFAAAVSYYGGGIGAVATEKPKCPVQMHFGEQDHAIPLAEVDQVRAAHPGGVEIFLYPAGHGFNCDERGSHDPASAARARDRALAFLGAHLAASAPKAAAAKAAALTRPAKPVAPKRAPVIAGGSANPKAAPPPETAPRIKPKARPEPKAKAKPKATATAKPKAKAKPTRKAAPARKSAKKAGKVAPKSKFLGRTARRIGRAARGLIGRARSAGKALRRR